jgi:hypothetical protein
MLWPAHDPDSTLERFLDQVAGQVPILIEIKSRNDRRFARCVWRYTALEGYRGDHGDELRPQSFALVRQIFDGARLAVTEEKSTAAGTIATPRRCGLRSLIFSLTIFAICRIVLRAAQRRRGRCLAGLSVHSPRAVALTRRCALRRVTDQPESSRAQARARAQVQRSRSGE